MGTSVGRPIPRLTYWPVRRSARRRPSRSGAVGSELSRPLWSTVSGRRFVLVDQATTVGRYDGAAKLGEPGSVPNGEGRLSLAAPATPSSQVRRRSTAGSGFTASAWVQSGLTGCRWSERPGGQRGALHPAVGQRHCALQVVGHCGPFRGGGPAGRAPPRGWPKGVYAAVTGAAYDA